MSELDAALVETLRPMVARLVREEVQKAGLAWRWQSVRQAAKTLDTSEASIRKRAQRGQLPTRKLNGRLYVDMETLDRQMARLR